LSFPGPNGAPGPTGPGRTLAAWLLTLECVGVLEVAAGSEVPLELELVLTGRLVLVVDVAVTLVADDRVVVEVVPELRGAAGARCRTGAAGRGRRGVT
jgi:hypothetical protein